MKTTLTAKQRAFVEHYLQCWNATEAARRAGYSAKTARQQAARLLSNVYVQAEIAGRIGELKASADEVLLRLASHSRGSMEDFISGESIDLDKARQRGKLHLVKKFKVTTTTDGESFETHRVELELYDAQAATVQLARILGQFIERIEIRDWRTELEKQGIDAGAAFERMVAAAAEAIGGPNGVGGDSGSQAPQEPTQGD